jgi:hypothetical protein
MMKRALTTVILLACTTVVAGEPVQYFPKSLFDKFVVGWYTSHLTAMNEPSLFQMIPNRDAHSYRFLWLRSFHRPIAIRLDIGKRAGGILTVKELSGAGGYDPGMLRLKTIVPMTAAEVSSFLSAVSDIGFWNLPTREPNLGGLDGAQWVLEGVHAGQYHVVDRWTPREGPYRELCLKLLAASKLVVDDVY